MKGLVLERILALNVTQEKVLCSAEKSSVIWAEPHSRGSAEQFCRSERLVSHCLAILFRFGIFYSFLAGL